MNRFRLCCTLACLVSLTNGAWAERSSDQGVAPEEPVALLDATLSRWDVFMGVPHVTVDLDGVDKSQDGKTGTPLGLHRDPKNVFTVADHQGQPVLRVSGEIYAGLTTKAPFENYHFRAEFKWGEQKWAPRLNAKRDSGLLYHCTGGHGAFWNAWMRSVEFQVQEGDCGDLFTLAGTRCDVTLAPASLSSNGKPNWMARFESDGPATAIGAGLPQGGATKLGDAELPNGEWNTLDLYVVGDEALHVVNGQPVMLVRAMRLADDTPLTSGKIQIQSEGAEAFYRAVTVRPITELPVGYLDALNATAPSD